MGDLKAEREVSGCIRLRKLVAGISFLLLLVLTAGTGQAVPTRTGHSLAGATVLTKIYGPDTSGQYGGSQGEGWLLGVNSAGIIDHTRHVSFRGRAADVGGHVYMGARYYDAGTRTFLSADPLDYNAGINLYSYAAGDPVNFTDPDGRIAKQVGSSIGSGLRDGYFAFGDTLVNAVPATISAMSSLMGSGMDLMGMPHRLHDQAQQINQSLSPYARSGSYNPTSPSAMTASVATMLIAPKAAFARPATIGAQTTTQSAIRTQVLAARATPTHTTVFQGLEVRAVRDLGHVDDATLRAMSQNGFAPRTINGDKIVLHHHQQNPAGFIVEMPAPNHSIGNVRQHPFGNTAGAGLTAEQRAAFNQWRTDYWKSRAQEELTRRAGQ